MRARAAGRGLALAVVFALGLAGCGAGSTNGAGGGSGPDAAAATSVGAPSSLSTTTTTAPPPPPPPPPEPAPVVGPLRVAVFGDSTAYMSAFGLGPWLEATGQGTQVEGFTGLGCGIVRTPVRRVHGQLIPNPEACDWPEVWPSPLDQNAPNVAVVQSGNWDIADLELGDPPAWVAPGEPEHDSYVFGEMLAAVDLLASRGAVVVWLTSPRPGGLMVDTPEWNPAERLERYNALVHQLAAARPTSVVVVDLAAWMATLTVDEDVRLRPDGVHFTEETSQEVCERFLCQAIVDAVR